MVWQGYSIFFHKKYLKGKKHTEYRKLLNTIKYINFLKEQLEQIGNNENEDISKLNVKIIEAMQRASLFSEEKVSKETEREDANIKNLQKRRATLLKIKKKSATERIELYQISKLIRNDIRQKTISNKNEIIKKVPEENENIRVMNNKNKVLEHNGQPSSLAQGRKKFMTRKKLMHISQSSTKIFI